jgi:hypothetical protein
MPEKTVRDKYWKRVPQHVIAWAAIGRDGEIMAATVRPQSEDVKLACGDDCVPIRVKVTYWPEANQSAT